ncbi:MAG TPA: DsbA family protein [Solirubrobacteraceae bacterium]|nr:DsbA family protein [Solirubrobacteraceae bacterium]
MRDHQGMAASAPTFFFGAMSPYSWLAAERIEQLLPRARWQVVLAGAVFKANDRTSWGLTADRDAGIADCEARAAGHGKGPIRWPDPWPTSDLLVARAMCFAEGRGMLERFALSAMRLSFIDGRDLGELDAVLESARRTGLDPEQVRDALADPEIKAALRRNTDEALALGVWGVPTVIVDGELFWGDDRLQEAADAAARQGA